MDLIATFVPNTGRQEGFRIAWLLPDARTSFGRPRLVSTPEMLIRVLLRMGADETDLRKKLRYWGQGMVSVRPNEVQTK